MFKVKVDKQTQSHRCKTAGKVSGGLVENVETSLFTLQAEVQLLSLFSCISNAAPCVTATHRSKVQPGSACACSSSYSTLKCAPPPPHLEDSLQVLARSVISSL